MEKISFRIDEFTKNEMDKFLKIANVSQSNFIRICIIEKLNRINLKNEEAKENELQENKK